MVNRLTVWPPAGRRRGCALLRRRYRAGMPATRMPTLADVARQSGVSLATASKALSAHADRCDLAAATRERVLATAAALGYRRHRPASARARKRSRAIGLAWGRHAPRVGGVYEQHLEVLALALKARGYHLLFTPVEDAADWRAMQFAQRLDGVILVESVPDAVLADIEAREYPAVLLNQRSPRAIHQVLADDAGGMAALIAHLAAQGHRRLAYVGPRWPSGHCSEGDRRAAVLAAAAVHGLAVVELPAADPPAVAAACAAAAGGPTAVVAYHHTVIPVLAAALRAAGLALPGGVALASGDEVSWLAFGDPPVTAAVLPMAAMAERAAAAVIERVEAREPPGAGVEVLAESLLVRASTDFRLRGEP